MNKIVSALFTAVLISGCSDTGSSNTPTTSGSQTGFSSLPESSAEKVTVSGNMIAWLYEGDGGCFGTLRSGSSEIELWADVETCGDKDYADDEEASVEITYNTGNQYGDDKTYTITEFK